MFINKQTWISFLSSQARKHLGSTVELGLLGLYIWIMDLMLWFNGHVLWDFWAIMLLRLNAMLLWGVMPRWGRVGAGPRSYLLPIFILNSNIFQSNSSQSIPDFVTLLVFILKYLENFVPHHFFHKIPMIKTPNTYWGNSCPVAHLRTILKLLYLFASTNITNTTNSTLAQITKCNIQEE